MSTTEDTGKRRLAALRVGRGSTHRTQGSPGALRGERGWRRRVRAIGLVVVVCCWCVVFGLVPVVAGAARHFEKVSPADKGQGDIVGDGATTVAALAGDAVAFNSRTPFGDTVGSGTIGQTQYVARRTAEAWVVHAITPTPRPDALQTFFSPTLLELYSDDLRSAVVRGYDLPAATDDTPLRNNLYVEDTATLALRTVTVSQVEVPTIPDFLSWPLDFRGISADARHVAFVTATQFLPDAAPGVPNVYAWDDGVLRVASVLPDGTVPPDGADTPVKLRGAMSADGSRLLFTAPTSPGGNPQLFVRIDGSRTVWVSQSEVDRLADPTNVLPLGMTPDGRSVFFTTDMSLLSDDGNSGTDLYRYTDRADPSTGSHLRLISQTGDLDGGQLIGMSDDGERVYFYTITGHLVAWDHGRSQLISNAVPFPGAGSDGFGLTSEQPGYGRVTSDGMFLAFGTNVTVDGGVHGLTGEVTNGHRELYLYSLRDGSLTCCSCPSQSAISNATVLPESTLGNPTLGNSGFRPRFLSEDGRVFFSSGDALVAQDTNGVLDTYEYDPVTGSVSLLSTGTGKDPSTFADASASGDDVFIVTRQRLVASDHDNLVDLYDVRDGSSLPPEVVEQPRLECEGDGCQPLPSGNPPDDPLGSLSFEDGGAGSAGVRLLSVRQRVAVRGASGSLSVKLFAGGRLAWSGRGLQAGSIRRGRSGTVEVRLRLSRRARLRLRASGVYTTTIHFTFVSVGGDEVKRATRVTFRVAARKGR
jgi:hypothetical protein